MFYKKNTFKECNILLEFEKFIGSIFNEVLLFIE